MKASAFFFIVCMLPPNMFHLQHKQEADAYNLVSSPPGSPEPS